MQLSVTGHHVEITDSLRDYVQEKIERIQRHFDQIRALIKKLIAAEKPQKPLSDSKIAAIDALSDKLDRQVRKHKEKLTDHHRNEGGLKSQQPG